MMSSSLMIITLLMKAGQREKEVRKQCKRLWKIMQAAKIQKKLVNVRAKQLLITKNKKW